MKGWMYILECSDGSYYTGSTNNLDLRIQQHQNGDGANHTKKRLPVKLVYFEEFQRVDEAFYREKQVQGWSRKKKEALIQGDFDRLSHLSKNYTQFPIHVVSTGSTTEVKELGTVVSAGSTTNPIHPLTELAQTTNIMQPQPLTELAQTTDPIHPLTELAEVNTNKLKS